MLKMKCTNCEAEIASPLLAELEQIDCPHCAKKVPVQDVIIHAQGYSYHRDDLIRRLFRYKTLISEVSKERALLERSPEASDESKHSLDRFLTTLEEMLAGARDHLRIEFERPLPVSYSTTRLAGNATLANLSMQGACLNMGEGQQLPKSKSAIEIVFLIPGSRQSVTLNGKVVWQKKATAKQPHPQIGIDFSSLDSELRATIWAFISHAADPQNGG